jgi:hypothetical protein
MLIDVLIGLGVIAVTCGGAYLTWLALFCILMGMQK